MIKFRKEKTMDKISIGKKIREKRLEKDWNQEELAERSYISADYIGKIERGERLPSLSVLIQIIKALSVPPEDILIGVPWYKEPKDTLPDRRQTDRRQNGEKDGAHDSRIIQYAEKIGKPTQEDKEKMRKIIEIIEKFLEEE
jgi:transcriptional regulator with XRE-family HTH domain